VKRSNPSVARHSLGKPVVVRATEMAAFVSSWRPDRYLLGCIVVTPVTEFKFSRTTAESCHRMVEMTE
jgi:hypothetical protein